MASEAANLLAEKFTNYRLLNWLKPQIPIKDDI
jgi:hypothetical protein